MTISRRLYIGFGIILGILLIQFVVALYAMNRERNSKGATQKTGEISTQMMQDRVFLANYLLSGDGRELDKLNKGMGDMADLEKAAEAATDSRDQKDAFRKAADGEREWFQQFATPLVNKRKQVDAGNATVAELQIYYLQL